MSPRQALWVRYSALALGWLCYGALLPTTIAMAAVSGMAVDAGWSAWATAIILMMLGVPAITVAAPIGAAVALLARRYRLFPFLLVAPLAYYACVALFFASSISSTR